HLKQLLQTHTHTLSSLFRLSHFKQLYDQYHPQPEHTHTQSTKIHVYNKTDTYIHTHTHTHKPTHTHTHTHTHSESNRVTSQHGQRERLSREAQSESKSAMERAEEKGVVWRELREKRKGKPERE